MSKFKVGYVPIDGNPCALCCLQDVCPQEGFCKCDEYWAQNQDDPRNEDSEVYFIETKED